MSSIRYLLLPAFNIEVKEKTEVDMVGGCFDVHHFLGS